MLSEGVRMVPVETHAGTFHVWTRRVGDNPALKVLLLHGGPGATHEEERRDGHGLRVHLRPPRRVLGIGHLRPPGPVPERLPGD